MRRALVTMLAILLLASCAPQSDPLPNTLEQNMGLGWGGWWRPRPQPVQVPDMVDLTVIPGMVNPLRIDRLGEGFLVTDPGFPGFHILNRSGFLERSVVTDRRILSAVVTDDSRILLGGIDHLLQVTRWGEVVTNLQRGLATPGDLLQVPSGGLLLTDPPNQRIVWLDGYTSFDHESILSGWPVGISPGKDEFSLVVLETQRGQIHVIDRMGSVTSSHNISSKVSRGEGIWYHDGYFMVPDVLAGDLVVFDSQGRFGTRRGSMIHPSDLLVDTHGRLWITSYGTGEVHVWGVDDFSEPDLLLPLVATSVRGPGNGATWVDLHVGIPDGLGDRVDEDSLLLDGTPITRLGNAIRRDVNLDGVRYDVTVRLRGPELRDLGPDWWRGRLSGLTLGGDDCQGDIVPKEL